VRAAPDDPEALLFEPHLPPSFRALVFPFAWRRRQLAVAIEEDAIEVTVEGAAPLPIQAGDQKVIAEPGVRYVTRRREGGFSRWEGSS
jgi:trehalose/maltose hydrolase-like predicted phosphorylase